jgi:hypothetical protein
MPGLNFPGVPGQASELSLVSPGDEANDAFGSHPG